jgi:hypothetical protein
MVVETRYGLLFTYFINYNNFNFKAALLFVIENSLHFLAMTEVAAEAEERTEASHVASHAVEIEIGAEIEIDQEVVRETAEGIVIEVEAEIGVIEVAAEIDFEEDVVGVGAHMVDQV